MSEHDLAARIVQRAPSNRQARIELDVLAVVETALDMMDGTNLTHLYWRDTTTGFILYDEMFEHRARIARPRAEALIQIASQLDTPDGLSRERMNAWLNQTAMTYGEHHG